MTATDDFFVTNDLRITCADATELVTDYLDGALVSVDLANVEAHLSLCEGCQVFTQQIAATVALVGSIEYPNELLPANFEQLLQALARSTGAAS